MLSRKQVGINIKRFILAVENLTGRSISSLGGSYSPNVNGVVNTAMAATLGGTANVSGGVKFCSGRNINSFIKILLLFL